MVKTAEIDGMTVVIDAQPTAADVAGLPADPGRAVPDPDEPIGRTELALFELPALGEAMEAGPMLFAAASNMGRWKTVPIELRVGQEQLPGLVLGRRAVLGSTTTILDSRVPLTLDEISSVTVRLVNSGQHLLNADVDAMAAGANLAIVGDELIQFGRAERLEPGLYRLSHFLRGRRGTEWACPTHRSGERFCLFNPAALGAIELPSGVAGAVLTAVSHGIGDVAPLPEVMRLIGGEAMRPPSVCHLSARRDGTDVELSWVRRSPSGWSWNDGVGVPSNPYAERYQVSVTGPGGQMAVETDRPLAVLGSASLPGARGDTVEFNVSMAGPMAMSRPRGISLIL